MAKIKTLNLNKSGVLNELQDAVNTRINEDSKTGRKEDSSNGGMEETKKPVKEEKKKRNYMLTDTTVTQLLELQLHFVGNGEKKDLSKLVTEAVADLYNKYLGKK